MKIVQFLLDYIDPSYSEQAKQYINGINFQKPFFTKTKSVRKRIFCFYPKLAKIGVFVKKPITQICFN